MYLSAKFFLTYCIGAKRYTVWFEKLGTAYVTFDALKASPVTTDVELRSEDGSLVPGC